MKTADRIATLFILALCVFFFVHSRDFGPLSALFPRVVMVILGSLALLQFVLTFTRRKERESFEYMAFRHVPTLLSLALMIGWIVFIPVLGFLVSALVFFALITLYLDRKASLRRKLGRVGIAWGTSVAFWLFFTHVLYVPFPRGLLF